MPIRHDQSGHDGVFRLEKDGQQAGELYYQLAGGRMLITHTEVSPALRGGGLARTLVDAAVAFARAENLKVASRCSYASAVFARSPAAFADVLAR